MLRRVLYTVLTSTSMRRFSCDPETPRKPKKRGISLISGGKPDIKENYSYGLGMVKGEKREQEEEHG